MRTVPVTTAAKITFFENHLPVWGPAAETIGLTEAQVAELEALTAEARDAHLAAIAARDAAQAATLAQNRAVSRMASFGGDLVKTVRAFAQTTDDASVFAAAQIPAPRRGAPLGPAPMPTGLAASLTSAGEILLRWEARTEGRLGFVIERRTQTPGRAFGGWTLVGTATGKTFTDTGVPVGLESAQYRVTAERPGGRSEPTEPVVVLFGTGGRTEAPLDARLAA